MWDNRLPLKRVRIALLACAFLSASSFPSLFLSDRNLLLHTSADATAQTIPFSQNWTSAALITTSDNWSGVPGIEGFLGDGMTGSQGVDPQTLLSGAATTLDVQANLTNPETSNTGGVGEFESTFQTIALQGSGTADAPNIVITLNTMGKTDLTISYKVRDIEDGDNAVQQVALQYRVGNLATTNYTNIPAGFIADATTNAASQVTTFTNLALPSAIVNKPLVQLRIITSNANGNDEWIGIDDISVSGVVILHADLESFTATESGGRPLLEWRTGMEVDNLGFNIYREDQGRRSRVNRNILAGSALLAGPGVRMGAGRNYSFRDPAPSYPGTRYFLEAIDLDGTSIHHGPVSVDSSIGRGSDSRPGRREAMPLSMLASADETESGTRLVEPRAPVPSGSPAQLEIQARLAGSPAVKLAVEEEGLYRISHQQLVSAGLNSGADARKLQLYVDGIEQPINIVRQNGASFQAVEFYGRGLDDYASKRRVYWLIEGDRAGARIKRVKTRGATGPGTSFLSEVERADRSVYFSNLRNGEAENFFGAVIVRDPVEQSISLKQVDRSAAREASIEVALQGVTLNHHRLKVEINGENAGLIEFDGQQPGVLRTRLPQSMLREGDNSVRLVSEANETTVSLVRRIGVSYWRMYRADADELRFTVEGREAVKVTGFSGREIRVLDVTDEQKVKEVRGDIIKEGDGYSIKVGGAATGARRLLAYVEGTEKRVEDARRDRPSSLLKPATGADYVLISHGNMIDSLASLKELRQSEGLKVASINVEDVYDEYSFGHKSAGAIRRFLQTASAAWETKPRYVLLVGDGSFDPKDYLGDGANDFIPAKMIDTAQMETASDEWYVEGAGAPMAIGRLPVRSGEEAARMAAKIVRYEDGTGSQGERRGVLLVSDSEENNGFEQESGKLKALAGGEAAEIRRGQMGSEGAKDELMWALARGQMLVNYIGHGSVDLWRGDVMTGEDAQRLGNRDRLSVYVLMTCLNGYFEDASIDSLAESLMKAEGGAALVWASTGLTEIKSQGELNEAFYRELFAREGVRIGDAVVKAKAAVTDPDAKSTWVILGDPAARLR